MKTNRAIRPQHRGWEVAVRSMHLWYGFLAQNSGVPKTKDPNWTYALDSSTRHWFPSSVSYQAAKGTQNAGSHQRCASRSVGARATCPLLGSKHQMPRKSKESIIDVYQLYIFLRKRNYLEDFELRKVFQEIRGDSCKTRGKADKVQNRPPKSCRSTPVPRHPKCTGQPASCTGRQRPDTVGIIGMKRCQKSFGVQCFQCCVTFWQCWLWLTKRPIVTYRLGCPAKQQTRKLPA